MKRFLPVFSLVRGASPSNAARYRCNIALAGGVSSSGEVPSPLRQNTQCLRLICTTTPA
jgi:hypothetical protein